MATISSVAPERIHSLGLGNKSKRFSESKTVCGFAVGGLVTYNAGYCYANCLRVEGRESGGDFWQLLDEVEYDLAGRRTRYFDFPVNRTVGQLRIMQDITHGTAASNIEHVNEGCGMRKTGRLEIVVAGRFERLGCASGGDVFEHVQRQFLLGGTDAILIFLTLREKFG